MVLQMDNTLTSSAVLLRAIEHNLNADIEIGGEKISSFFVPSEQPDQLLIFDNFPDRIIEPNQQIEVKFSIVVNGILNSYKFQSEIRQRKISGFFDTLICRMPAEIDLFEEDRKYTYIARNDEVINFQHYFKTDLYNEEAVGISRNGIQFYSKIPRSQIKKILWNGKKIDECVLQLPDGVINFSAQIQQVIAGNYHLKITSIQPDDQKRLSEFVTKLFLLNERHSKLYDEAESNYERSVVITSSDELLALAARFKLSQINIRSSYVPYSKNFQTDLMKSRPRMLIVDSAQQNQTSFRMVSAVKNESIWRGLPVLILDQKYASHHEKAKQVGALDIIDRTTIAQNLADVVRCGINVDSGIENDPENARLLVVTDAEPKFAYGILRWGAANLLNIEIQNTIGELARRAREYRPQVILVNLSGLRLQAILQKCEDLVKEASTRNIPVLIRARAEEIAFCRPEYQNHIPVPQISDNILAKILSMLKK